MKSHVLLVGRVLEDISTRCCVSTTKDLEKILSRVEQEGETFLTLALPELGGVLERGLRDARLWSSSGPESVRFRLKKRTCLPAMFFGLWAQVFNAKDGHLLDEPSVDAIQALRQVCNLFKKILHPCSQERVDEAFSAFVECDKQVGLHDWSGKDQQARLADFTRLAMVALGDVLTASDREVWAGDIIPKHGPGSTADRTLANAKYDYRIWTTRLERIFFAGDFLYPSWSHFLEAENRGQGPTYLEPGDEIPVRVVSVPKTLKTPRIIAIEPVHMQYVQQGLSESLVNKIERHDILSHLIGFTDQEYSRTLACEGSRTSDLATLDLSEASDRVSTVHVRWLLRHVPSLLEGVLACRSQTAQVPGHGVISLSKYASMGSALTFPIEAMVFLTIVLVGIERELKCHLTERDLRALIGKVRVYGDDIVVPVEYASSVVRELEAFGLRVNSDKSFWTGKFRESCGGEFFDGFDVGYVKVRRDLPSQRKHARELISAVETRNLFYQRGYWRTAEFYDELIGNIIPFPRVGPDSPALGRHSYLGYDVERECPYLQRPLVRAAIADSKIPDSDISGTGALLKFFLKAERSDEPTADKKHLLRAGRPVAVNIRLRWVPSY